MEGKPGRGGPCGGNHMDGKPGGGVYLSTDSILGLGLLVCPSFKS